MACSSHDDLQLTLLDFVHGKHKKEVEKPAKPLVEYKIPTGIVDRARKLKFTGDKVKLPCDIYIILKIYVRYLDLLVSMKMR